MNWVKNTEILKQGLGLKNIITVFTDFSDLLQGSANYSLWAKYTIFFFGKYSFTGTQSNIFVHIL